MINLNGTTTGYGANTAELANADIRIGNGAAPSNGIYSPAANQLALSTAGTGRLFVDASGKVGIGTSAPSTVYRQTVNGDGSSVVGGLSLRNNGTETLTIGNVTAANDVDSEIWNPRNGYLRFATNNTERLRITSTGNVGIGTSSPNRLLETSAASDNFIRVNVSSGAYKSGIEFANGSAVYAQLYFNNVSPYDLSLLQQYSTGSLILGTNNTERARIDSSGRLLVGTSTALSTSANNKVQIAASSTSGVSTIQEIYSFNTGGGIASLNLHRSNSNTLGTNALVTSGQPVGAVSFAGADGSNFIPLARILGEVDGTAAVNDMPGRLVFSTTADGAASPSERMRIDSSGRVGIGTTSPAAPLHVAGNIRSGVVGTDGSITLNRATDGLPIVAISYDGASEEARFNNGSGNGRIVFQTVSTERARIDSSGRLLVGTSTATANGGVLQVSNGITFPGTQSACSDPNTLDDYEEGTFTPTVIGSGTAGTATYTNQTGIYTKIGRQVHFNLYVNWTSGTGTGNLRIDGLPFLVANTTNNSWPVSFGLVDGLSLLANTTVTGYANQNTSYLLITYQVVGGGAYGLQAYDSAAHLLISGSYATA